MSRGIRIGKLFGIDFSLDYSWFVMFALVTFGLSFALFPQLVPGLSLGSYITIGVITSLLFFGSVLLHEVMHSLVAKSYGMNIEGIRLMLFGGVSQLTDEPKSAAVEFKMAVAGPLSSIVLGMLFIVLFVVGRRLDFEPAFIAPAFWLGYINVLLGVFNLLPGFPLDGGRVLRSAIWYYTGNLKRATGIATIFGKGLSYLMILAGVIGAVSGNLNLLWFLFLGWYLLRAAESSYQQVIIEEAIEGLRVEQAMTQNPKTVDPDLSIDTVIKEGFMKDKSSAYPVVENDKVEGVISINNIKNLPPRSWRRKHVRDVMEPLSGDNVATPDTEISDAINKINRSEGNGYEDRHLVVIKGGRLIGILNRVDINRAIYKVLRLKAEEQEDQQGKSAA